MDIAEFPHRLGGAVLTPDAPGLSTLVALLRMGGQIRTRHSGATPVFGGSGPADTLACETSGSSGAPKTVLRRTASWYASFDVTRRYHAVTPGDRYAAFGSLGHSLPLYAAFEGLSLGADLALLAGSSARRHVMALRDLGITVLYATPVQLGLLCVSARACNVAALPNLRLVMSGGGPCSGGLRAEVGRLCPNAVFRHFYGTSETSFVSWTGPDTPEGSVGRVYPGVDLSLDARGAIRVSSPYLFEGYEGADRPDPAQGARQVATGEIGRFDRNGFLYLRGRADRMVTVGDLNVFPEEIEAAILHDPAISLCAAIARPDPRRGHRIVCAVQGSEDAGLVRRLRRRCREAVGPEAVPHRFVFMERLPLLRAGKPDIARIARELPETP